MSDIIEFKAVVKKTQTLSNGDKRITIDVDIADKKRVAELDNMTEADGIMVAVAISEMD